MPPSLEKLKKFAMYYPNLGCVSPIKLFNTWTNCTNDWGTASGECRHFIDVECLKNLDYGHDLYESMVEPVPFCDQMTGKAMENQTIRGMLSKPLKAAYVFKNIHPNSVVNFHLKQVLVIDRLPVPFHLSAKRIAYHGFDKIWYQIQKDLGFQPKITAEGFPEEYRHHPYWTSDTIFIGHSNHDEDLAEYLFEESLSAQDEVEVVIP